MRSRLWSSLWGHPIMHLWLPLMLLMALVPGGMAAAAQPAGATVQGTIAYVRPNDTQGDEIRLVEPDGTGDRLLWRTNHPHSPGLVDIGQLAWRPDAGELTFTGHHEAACSWYATDIYAIQPDGSGYRRVTAPPGCGRATGLTTGTVRVTIENYTTDSGPFVVYIEGAPKPQSLVLAPGHATTVTFEDVVDYGSQIQWAVVIFGQERYYSVSGHADVQPGQTVDTDGAIQMWSPMLNWGWRWPTWRRDGAQLAYVFGPGTLYAIDADNTAPGAIGDILLDAAPEKVGGSDYLTWAPSAARAGQFLYAGYRFGEDESGMTIFLVHEGSSLPGEPLVWVGQGMGRMVLGLAWLPDGSGFVYSTTEGFGEQANLYVYRFDAQQASPVTSFANGYARDLSLSPDGQQVIFEYQPSGEWTDLNPPIDLWQVELDGGEPELFLENGRAPAWSLRAPQVPAPPAEKRTLYLALLTRPQAPSSGGQNLLQNPGFENSATEIAPWHAGPQTTWQLMDNIKHSGARAINLYSGTDGADFTSQEVTIPADATSVQVQYWYSWLSTETKAQADTLCAALTEPGVSQPRWRQCLDVAGKDTQDWALAQSSLSGSELASVRGKTLTLTVGVMTDAENFTEVWLDDFAVVVNP